MRHLSKRPSSNLLIQLEHVLGLDSSHVKLDTSLTPTTSKAFLKLQNAAQNAGFNLQIASGYRSFSRQCSIWNDKMQGKRPVFDDHNQLLDLSALSSLEKIYAILRWSALPSTSRHHWGTDLDIYDPNLLPQGQALQLQPWEYHTGGYFAPLTQWLSDNLSTYGFIRPYTDSTHPVSIEPWHISYLPEANCCAALLTASAVSDTLKNADILGKKTLLTHLDDIFQNVVVRFV